MSVRRLLRAVFRNGDEFTILASKTLGFGGIQYEFQFAWRECYEREDGSIYYSSPQYVRSKDQVPKLVENPTPSPEFQLTLKDRFHLNPDVSIDIAHIKDLKARAAEDEDFEEELAEILWGVDLGTIEKIEVQDALDNEWRKQANAKIEIAKLYPC